MRSCGAFVAFVTCAVLALVVARPAAAQDADTRAELSLAIGSAERLPSAQDEPARWESSDAKVAAAYGNGTVVGLSPGVTTVRAVPAGAGGPAREFAVTVTAPGDDVRDVASIRQFPDDRSFTTEGGRRCVGTELNGQLVGNVQEPRIDRNRVRNPNPLRDDEPMHWAVRESATLYDGAGTPLGTIAPSLAIDGRRVPATKINYGMTKVIGGRLHVYAFATRLRPADPIRPLLDEADVKDGAVGTSAWLPLDDVTDKDALIERVGVGRGKLPRLPLEDERLTVTGGDPKQYLTDAGRGAELQINYYAKGVGAVPSHYLRRPSGTVNITYNVPGFKLGGQSLDSLLVTSGATFRPAAGVRPITRPLYYPPGHPSAGAIAEGRTITFVYGAVEAPRTETIFGWVAREALGERENE